jgi:nicotinamide-nucleotide amidase
MFAEVIAIGDELTSGQRVDTNSQWLSSRLGELGVEVRYHTTVADDLESNVAVFRAAIERADIVVASGGLGPTADDLTREALAKATGQPLVLDTAVLDQIVSLFARRRRPMPDANRIQAMFPAGGRPIPNPAGTAPGIDLEVPRVGRNSCRVFALPGVPAEMFRMWSATVAGAIAAMQESPMVLVHRRIKCFGVGESDLEKMLPDLIHRGREPRVGITVSAATITLRITASGPTPEVAHAATEPTVATIRDCLGNLIFGEGDDELQHAVLRLLRDRRATLATIEWGTEGLLANWLAEAGGNDRRFVGGVVTPHEVARVRLRELAFGGQNDVQRAQPQAATGPDEEIKAEVAELARVGQKLFRGDYVLATGPLPDYDPDSSIIPEFHYALASPNGVAVRSSPYAGNPDILKLLSAKRALNWIRLELM